MKKETQHVREVVVIAEKENVVIKMKESAAVEVETVLSL